MNKNAMIPTFIFCRWNENAVADNYSNSDLERGKEEKNLCMTLNTLCTLNLYSYSHDWVKKNKTYILV